MLMVYEIVKDAFFVLNHQILFFSLCLIILVAFGFIKANSCLVQRLLFIDSDMLRALNDWREEVDEASLAPVGITHVYLEGRREICRLYVRISSTPSLQERYISA